MKEFIQEYGGIVVSAIVIMIVVVAATPIGNSLKDGITQTITKLTTQLGKTAEVGA